MKNNKKFIVSILLILIIFYFIGFVIFKGTYSTDESMNDNFIANNLDEFNLILERNNDINNPYYITEILDDNGNVPAYNYYSDNQYKSRGINDLTAYDNKIFMGLGDYSNNTGPVKIIYYNTLNKKIESSGTVSDEEIQSFTIIDNKLYTVGTDPRENWGYGSYYVYNIENNSWDKHRFNNGWVHVYDFEEFNDKLFMCGSVIVEGERTPIQVSYDNGGTFENVKIVYSDGTQLPYDSYIRFYSLFKYKKDLYAHMYYYNSRTKYDGVYKYDEEKNQFDFIQSNVALSYPFYNSNGQYVNSYPAFERFLYVETLRFNDLDLYISGHYLYTLYDISNEQIGFKPIHIDNNYAIQNGVINGDTLYLLACSYNEDSSFNVRIYKTDNLEKFDVVYEFTTDSFPYSIEYFNNYLYIGTYASEYIKDTASVGSLYEIDLNKIEKKLVLNKDNSIDVVVDGDIYTAEYNITPEETIFNTTLTFTNNMSKEELNREIRKFKNLNILYALSSNRNNINYNNSLLYFNNIFDNIIDTSAEYDSAEEIIEDIFSNNLNVQNRRFTITSENISNEEDEFNVLITLKVFNIDDTVVSEKYIINEKNNFIFIGNDSDPEIIESNLFYSDNIRIEIENNNLLLFLDDEIIRSYNLISFNTDNTIIDKYIYTNNLTDDEIIKCIDVINGTATVNDNKIQIKYNELIVDEYGLIRYSSDNAIFLDNDKIYVGNEAANNIKNIIKIVNAEISLDDNKIKILHNDIILSEINLLSINFGEFSVKDKTIIISDTLYDDFINNIAVSNGITYKFFNDGTEINPNKIAEGMYIKIYYNNIEIDSFNFVNGYLHFDKSIIVDEENRYLYGIPFNKIANYILNKIDTTGIISIMNNKDELISGNDLIGTGSRLNVKMTKKNYDYLFVIKGDVNGDGNLTLNDVNNISKYVYNDKNSLKGIYLTAADIDNNKSHNLEDIMKTAYNLHNYIPQDNLSNKLINSYNNSEQIIEKTVGDIKYNLDDTNNLIKDIGGNIRYYGKDPNNYVYFNCDTYPDKNCEIWRIIGVFDGKIKLIKNTGIGLLSYDYDGNNQNLARDWSQSTIKNLLNDEYLNNKNTTYNNASNKETLNFKTDNNGIKNNTRNLISNNLYSIGGWYSMDENIYAHNVYLFERGNNAYNHTFSLSWMGKVALPYQSDYLYSADFNYCNYSWNEYKALSCVENNWMSSILAADNHSWLLTHVTNNSHGVLCGWVINKNHGGFSTSRMSSSFNIVPVVYLHSDINVLSSGDGSFDNPYQIVID